ncbi:MAG: HAMP domain-containing sensor histidine kinase [Thermoleophilia bacterium]
MRVWLAAILFVVGAVLLVFLLAKLVGSSHRLRKGYDGDGPDRPTLRTTLFRTLLITLVALALGFQFLSDRNQRDSEWPVAQGMLAVDQARVSGATWIDDEAYAAIRDGLRRAAGWRSFQSSSSGGTLSLDLESSPSSRSDLSAADIATLRTQGWLVTRTEAFGGRNDVVAWRTSADEVTFYAFSVEHWYWVALGYLLMAAVTALILSPLAAVAAWYLNRRIVKPVQQVAQASVVLADGGTPMTIPTKAPRELSILARSFNEMATRLRRAQDAEREFLLSVSHELKTPLTAIEGYAELLADEAVEPKRAAEALSEESARLRHLVGDLLDLARIGRAEFATRDETVDLAETAREVARRCRHLAAERGVTLAVDAPETAPARGDAGRLLQVASNLVENALRVTPPNGRVVVSARPGLLEVADTGPGLAADDVAHAFERFYLHGKYGDPQIGSGLGLALVKELVETMGGSVKVTSKPGEGSEFSVRLRDAQEAATQENSNS